MNEWVNGQEKSPSGAYEIMFSKFTCQEQNSEMGQLGLPDAITIGKYRIQKVFQVFPLGWDISKRAMLDHWCIARTKKKMNSSALVSCFTCTLAPAIKIRWVKMLKCEIVGHPELMLTRACPPPLSRCEGWEAGKMHRYYRSLYEWFLKPTIPHGIQTAWLSCHLLLLVATVKKLADSSLFRSH